MNRLNEIKKTTRKRKRNPSSWKDNSRKKLKDTGKAYKTRKGNPKEEKLSSNCDRVCKCTNEGCALLTKEIKADLFKKFYDCDYNAQSAILLSCMESVPINRRRNKKSESLESTSRKLFSFYYTIRFLNGEIKRICQKTLCDIYAVSHKRIQNIQNKMKNGVLDPKDERGKHSNRPHRITEETRQLVQEHIRSFPQMENHYSRNKTSTDNRMYLHSSLSLNKMFLLFKEKYPESNVHSWFYRDVFHNDFNLKIGQPRSDTCKTCDSLYLKLLAAENETVREETEAASETHHLKAEKGYASLKKDGENSKVNPKTVVLCVDLQQVMFLPMLTHSSIFYQRQLSCYNFAVHNPSTNHAQMFLWHEGIAKRGSSDISSCILRYIKENYQTLEENEERKLIIWSDRCVGQNNNWTTISLLLYLIKERYFTSAEQKFLVSGHSFLPCDRDFALIQRMVKKETAQVPSQLLRIIANARSSNPFEVTSMEQKDFFDFSALATSIKASSKLKVTKVAWLQLRKDDPNSIYARESHDIAKPWEIYRIVPVYKNGKPKRKICIPSILPLAYLEPLPIKSEKVNDLKDMIQYLSPEHKTFYEKLLSNKSE